MPPSTAPTKREAILHSLPDGSVLAGYFRPGDLGLPELLQGAAAARGLAVADTSGEGSGQRAEGLLGALPAGLAALLGGEGGLVIQGVTPTAVAPVPDVGVVLTLRDPAAAATTLRFAEASLGAVRLQGKAYLFEDVQYGGRTFRSFVQPLSEALTPSYLVDGDVALVTSSRKLMQQMIDSRRTGRRSVVTDRSFKRLRDFVPENASMAAYGDPQRLDRALAQVEPMLGRWAANVQSGVRDLRRLAPLGEHFPAGAVYAVRETDRIVLRGWMLEGN